MESKRDWQGWDSFLKEKAVDTKLAQTETEAFLISFDRQHIDKSPNQIALEVLKYQNDEAYNKTMGRVYNKFKIKGNKGKSKTLRKQLEEEYSLSKYANSIEHFSDVYSSKQINIPWQQVCREVLEQQRKQWLTSYPLGSGDRQMPEMYVPLELVEREAEEQPRIPSELKPEKWSVREQEKRTPISNEEFFEQVLQGKSSKSNGKRIAIIGEPGAGKTTLLQKIGSEVKELPIWIDLADLQPNKHESLQDYLTEIWLTDWALPIIRKLCPEATLSPRIATDELKNALVNEFAKGNVWLLLDGVDEMAASFRQPLTWVDRQLRGCWIADAKVVLTCRLNIWSESGNYLPDFDVYRNVDFTDEQVEEFIEKWFVKEPDLCQKLKEERNQANDRIKSLIRNPLRLTLLCLTWKKGGQKLPETKAGLYQRLVEGHYNWKKDKEGFALCTENQKNLNKWLGDLAKSALNDKDSRFRLRKSSIESFSTEHKQDNSLRELAIKVGWLVEVGLPTEDEKDADEPVYAFFHPTFQEYFAALAIDNYEFFLNHNNPKPNLSMKYNNEDCVYRIFDPRWKEVILMWLGRKEQISKREKEEFNQQKENFIDTLVNFEDGCGSFYKNRAYFLAASAMAEFPDYPLANQIVKQIVNWYFDLENPDRDKTLYPTKQNVETILSETNRTLVITELLEILHSYDTIHYRVREQVLSLLTKFINNHPIVIKDLFGFIKFIKEKLNFIEDESERRDAKFILIKAIDISGRTVVGQHESISHLLEIINSNDDEYEILEAVKSLNKIGTGTPEQIEALLTLISRIENTSFADEITCIEVVECLAKFQPNHPLVIPKLVKFIKPNQKKLTFIQERRKRKKGKKNHKFQKYDALNHLIRQLNDINRNPYINPCLKQREKALKRLVNLSSSNSTALNEILNIIKSKNIDEINRRKFIQALEEIEGKPNPAIINCLTKILERNHNKSTINQTAETLGKINPGDTLAINKLVETFNLNLIKDERTAIFVADSLGEIGKGNPKAIEALEKAIKIKKGFTLMRIADNLAKIAPDHPAILPTLENLTENLTENQSHRLIAAEKLGEIDKGNEIAYNTLLQAIVNNERMAMGAAYKLTKILQNEQMERVVKTFKDYLPNDKYKNRLNAFYEVLWHCAQNMSYPEFYDAWHKPSNTHPEAPDKIPVSNSFIARKLTLTQKIEIIKSTVASDSTFKDTVKLICIDGKFSDQNNPAIDIYIEMTEQGCPEQQEEPSTMQQLKKYWRLRLKKLEKQVALLFYNSKADREFSETCLTALSTFGSAIAIITTQPCENVQTISPNDPDLIDAVLKWLRRDILER